MSSEGIQTQPDVFGWDVWIRFSEKGGINQTSSDETLGSLRTILIMFLNDTKLKHKNIRLSPEHLEETSIFKLQTDDSDLNCPDVVV